MTFSYREQAQNDLTEAIAYYENIRTGLGREFFEEIKRTISRIAELPDMWPPVEENARRCLTDKFQYSIYYRFHEDEQELLIIAIMHNKQRPGDWKDRL